MCHLCGASFNQDNGLLCHTQRHHSQNQAFCPTDGKAFKNEKYLNSHFIYKHLKLEYVASSGLYVHVCEVCQKLFPDKRNLDYHMNVHRGKEIEIKCLL